MKVSSVTLSAVLGFAAIVAAVPQGTSAAPSVSYSVDPAVASTQACLKSCNAGDVYCEAHCEGLPTPDNTAVQATYDCVVKNCPQGNGTQEETAKYAACQASCVSSLYYTASSAWSSFTAPIPAGITPTSAPASTTSAGSAPTGSSGNMSSSAASGSPTAAPSPSGNSASSVNVGMSFAGVIGLFLAAIAL